MASPPNDPSRLAAGVLSAAMHLLLLLALVFGINWQSSQPRSVVVDLWSELPPQAIEAPKPEPKPEIKPEPPKPEIKPPPKPEPPKPEIKPPPKPEPPPAPKKPDIVVQKEVPKKEAPRKPVPIPDLDLSRQIREQATRELESAQREREKREALSQFKPLPAAPVRGDPGYADKVIAKIKPLIVLPPDIAGNPEAIVDVTQLPTGEVVDVRIRKKSGNQAYDDAIERAIRKASPLPRPDQGNPPPRQLELRFRPLER